MNLDDRPTPEELLQQIHDDDETSRRGHLHIFLGAAAGVGKTYALLKLARELSLQHKPIIIGYIETHGRADTVSMLPTDIEQIPLKNIQYKGKELKELDIDAALELDPGYNIIIDELAHTNAPGSRNTKRYQDVLELINAGINVYTAINVQHIESLNDLVEKITKIQVQETVPDQVLEDASEVILIDLSIEDLLKRLSDGKIYPVERIQTALNGFFRKSRLTALRELALRKTAQKVDQQVLEYKDEPDSEQTWVSSEHLLLVLEPDYSSEKLIRHGRNIFDKGFSRWFVGYVEIDNDRPLKEREDITQLLDLATSLGAEVVPLVGTDLADAIKACVNEYNINTVVLAQYRLPLYYKFFGKSLIERVQELVPDIAIQLITNDATETKTSNYQSNIKSPTNYRKLGIKFIVLSCIFGVLGLVLNPFIGILNTQNILMVYIFVMIISNKGRSKISSCLGAFVCALSYQIFIIKEHENIFLGSTQSMLTVLLLMGITIAFNTINGNLRFKNGRLIDLQKNNELLEDMSMAFANALVEKQIIDLLPEYFAAIFKSNYMFILPDMQDTLHIRSNDRFNTYQENIATWVFNNNQSAGFGTNTFANNSLLYLPITSTLRPRGILIIEPNKIYNFSRPDTQLIIRRFVKMLATTLERIHFTQIALQTEVTLATRK